MNDSELNDLLCRSRVPERSDPEWREISHDTARLAFAVRPSALDQTSVSSSLRKFNRVAVCSIGIAMACVFGGFFIGHWHALQRAQSNEIAEARKLFLELNAVFPNQLEAVVLDSSPPRLVLAENPSGDKGAPLFVRLCGARGCQRVITYSGGRVSLNGENCEVLLDARGHIIVTGDRFVWSSAEGSVNSSGYRIKAVAL